MMNIYAGGLIQIGFYVIMPWHIPPSFLVKYILTSNSIEKKMLP